MRRLDGLGFGDGATPGGRRSLAPLVVLPLGLPLALAAWAAVAARIDDRAIVPAPLAVAASAGAHADQLLYHGAATLQAVLLGFALGFGLALLLGFGISRSRLAERALMPYLVASQAVPVIAIAPLLMLALPDLALKVTVAALTVFFPMLINTVVGLKSVTTEQHDLMRLMSASRWQRLRFLELPAALPVLLAGLRVGITLSVIGAVVGEFVQPRRGLGVLILQSRGVYNQALTFAALLGLITLALALYGCAALLERLLLEGR